MPEGRRMLLTGATGMIGANLVRRLVAEGREIVLLTSPNSNLIRVQAVQERVRLVRADITDAAAVSAAVRQAQPEVVFHLINTRFTPSIPSPEPHYRVNVLGTLNLLEALREFPGVRVIYTGSVAEYGSGANLSERSPLVPGTVLGASKAAASLLLQTYARLYQMNTVVLRLFMPYGPWEHPQRLIPHVILSALQGQEVLMSEGKQQRDFLYMDDLVDALVLAAARPLPAGSVLNIASGVGVAVREVVERILHLMGNPVRAQVGALPTRPDEIMEMSGDITVAREMLGWQPRLSLEEGLRRAIAWFTEHRELALQLP